MFDWRETFKAGERITLPRNMQELNDLIDEISKRVSVKEYDRGYADGLTKAKEILKG